MSKRANPRSKRSRVAPREITLIMEEENRTANRMGDYSVTKYYDVINPNGSLATDINGWVVQIVEKTSVANTEVRGFEILDTTEKFMEFTSGQVNSMCSWYIERFEIINGSSTSGDAFAGGAVCKYVVNDSEEEEMLPLVNRHEDGYVRTRGRIVQKGINYLYIDPEKVRALERLPWEITENDPNDPSNGLSHISIEYRAAIEALASDSVNEPIHTVVATWDYNRPFTELNITIDNENVWRAKGGSKRYTRKNKI
jgi:hypothetical protein